MLKRIICLFLSMAMVFTMVPVQAFSAEDVAEPTDVVTEPAEELTAPAVEETLPAEETTAATEAVTEPAAESTAPPAPQETPEEACISGDTVSVPETVTVDVQMTEPDASSVAGGTCGDDLSWHFDEAAGTLTITGSGDMYDYFWDNMPWSAHREEILKVELPDGMTALGKHAFVNCTSLKEVNLPEGIPGIPEYAFNGCSSLETLKIPSSVKRIDPYAFSYSGLTELTLSEGLETIDTYAFSHCSGLKTVVLPESLKRIEGGAFMHCTALTDLDFPETLETISWFGFYYCTSLPEVIIPKSVTEIAYGAFGDCSDMGTVTFDGSAPKTDGTLEPFYNVTADAWYHGKDTTWTSTARERLGSMMTWKDLDNTVSSVPVSFYNQQGKLYATTTMGSGDTIPNIPAPAVIGYKFVGWFSNQDGTGIQVIPGETEWTDDLPVNYYAYYAEDPTDERIQLSVYAKYHVSGELKGTVMLYSRILDPRIDVFQWLTKNTDMTADIIHSKLGDAYQWDPQCYYDSLSGELITSEILAASGNPSVYVNVFAETVEEAAVLLYIHEEEASADPLVCELSGYAVGDTVTLADVKNTIETDYGYFGMNVQGLYTENAWAELLEGMGSNTVTGIRIADSGTTKIHVILKFESQSNSCGDNLTWSFDDATGTLTITGSGDMYDYAWEDAVPNTPWYGHREKITAVVVSEGVTAIGDWAFTDLTAVTEVSLPDTLTRLGTGAFQCCEALEYLRIPERVNEICGYALSKCCALRQIAIPEGVAEITEGMFHESYGLTRVTIPESVSKIGYLAFNGCMNLQEITIPGNVSEIDAMAFHRCTGLKTIIFEGNSPRNVSGQFAGMAAAAYYPVGNETWTTEVMQGFEGDITWVPYGDVINRLMLNGEDFSDMETIWIDGVEYAVTVDGDSRYVDLPDGNARVMTAYSCHVGNVSDVHSQYPVGMRVWTLQNVMGVYTAVRQEAFDNILQYSGMSIRVTGKKGIRMITSIENTRKAALTGSGLNGYTLQEYGTVIAWDAQLEGGKPLTLGNYYAKSNYAYKKDVADPVFRYVDGLIQYTNVLVNFSNNQCKNDIAMRPYMILQDPEGNEVTVYGGIVRRSIGYIAYQNRNTFQPDTDAYEYVWDIIHYVYGNIYDKEWIPSWSPPAM